MSKAFTPPNTVTAKVEVWGAGPGKTVLQEALRFEPARSLTLRFMYMNYQMEHEQREVEVLYWWYGASSFHTGEQWFLHGMDLRKQQTRNFAVRDMTDVSEMKREART